MVNADYAESGVPVIRGTNLNEGRYVGGEFVFVSAEKFARDLSRNAAMAGDVIYTQRGTLGQVALVPSSGPQQLVVSQSQMRLRVDRDRAIPEFVYYASTSDDFLQQIDDRAISTGVPHTNLGILSELEIPLPPLPEQQAIAEVLGALDDKIAANTAAKSAAEAFLNVSYVAAVGAGNDRTLGDVAAFHNRRRVPLSAAGRAERRGVIPYYGANGQMGTVDAPLFDEPIVLLGEDGSVCRSDGSPYVHYVWGPAWVNNHAHVLTGTKVSTELLSVMLRQADVSALVTGAVQPKLSMGQARRLGLVVPAESQLTALEQTVGAVFGSVRALTEENRTLASTRDALLPQLMSGKLRVRDAEKIVEAAT
ncbi:MAG: restriction endonuclease subunit S [Actinobacteria bacterium]|nr:restriction endonuclease subunit S [Actinomycetota bacterium]